MSCAKEAAEEEDEDVGRVWWKELPVVRSIAGCGRCFVRYILQLMHEKDQYRFRVWVVAKLDVYLEEGPQDFAQVRSVILLAYAHTNK